ncbi:hypothetical protein [Streptomyces sp. NPDC015125]|uniref:hypothetical protein n=1 Tax=Streptomyces sp. NPDC015125 TaxID=3364938 RepID=UPI0036F51457
MLASHAKPVVRKGVTAFLLISFAGTWLWLLFARAGLGLSPLNPLLQLPTFCTPGIAAVVVRHWVTNEGFAAAGLRIRRKTARRYYIVGGIRLDQLPQTAPFQRPYGAVHPHHVAASGA